MWPSHYVRMLDAMDVNTSITEPTTITPEIEEFYAAQIDRLIGLGREDLVAELVADYDRLLAEHAGTSTSTEAGGADRRHFVPRAGTRGVLHLPSQRAHRGGPRGLVDVLVAEYERS